jgi:hypothetical protein
MHGEWVRTQDGRDVYYQDDGWFFDYRSQGWLYNPDLITVPTGAPTSAKVEAWGDRMTEKPRGIWWSFANPVWVWNEAESFLERWLIGPLLFLITWACRGWIVYALGWVILNAGDAWEHLLWQPEDDTVQDKAVTAFCYLAGAVFAFLLLTITSLNQTQSNALTAAFIAHRAYQHFVDDVGQASARHHRGHYRGG